MSFKGESVLPVRKPSDHSLSGPSASWFCVQTHPKHEQIAAEHLRKSLRLETLNPRIRYQQPTRRGLVWFTESLFPGYIFARFDLQHDLDAVRYSPAVSQVVRFGQGYPALAASEIDSLKARFGSLETISYPATFNPGDPVRVVVGAFQNLTAVVQRVLPAKQRVMVLLEVLGRASAIELSLASIVHDGGRGALRLRA
jgi:transcriptional antiterminator RfaH